MGPDGRVVAAATKLSKAITHPHTDTTLTTMHPAACAAANTSSISGTSNAVKESSTEEIATAAVHGFSVVNLGHSWPTTAGLDGGKASFNATTANILPFFESQVLGS